MNLPAAIAVLVVVARSRACALHIGDVVETMRPLPVEHLPDLPAYLLGMAVIRGTATPVIDLGALIGSTAQTVPTRLVTIRSGHRPVALQVDSVVGTTTLSPGTLGELPPLAQGMAAGAIDRLGVLDGHLLTVLQAARLLPAQLRESLEKHSLPPQSMEGVQP